MNCPKCNTDISETYEPADHSVGIMGSGWYCEPCDLFVDDAGTYEPTEGDVPIMTAREFRGDRPLGTPISKLSGQPGDPNDPNDPRHAGYAEFCRIARSWGYN